MTRRKLYPDLCPAFEVITNGYVDIGRGCIVEGAGTVDDGYYLLVDGGPTGDWWLRPAEVRPLTPSARAMLALVRP